MKIGMLIAFAGRRCGGPEVYERELVRGMLDVAPEHKYHLYCVDRHAPEVIGVQDERLVYHVLQPSVRVLSMTFTLPREISRTRPDVFHAPMVTPPFCPPDTIMAIQCSSLIRHPEFYPPLVRMRLRFLLHRAAPKAGAVICPSKHVRDVVQEKFRLPDDRLFVIYPGRSSLFRPIENEEMSEVLQQKYDLRFPYFLFSGRWERRKNLVGILKAFALFKKDTRTEHRLVLTGGRSWDHTDAEKVIRELNIGDVVVDLGKTPIDDLPYLYGGADALVYASLWEGFGMPIVEAMACGTPVITSNISAMPEVAGGAALLVDPHSPESIADAMRQIAQNDTLRKTLRDSGLRRASHFTWQNTAKLTWDIYQRIVRHDNTNMYSLSAG